MSYLEKALTPGERLIAQGRLHWILWLRAWAALILLGVLLIGIYFFVTQTAYLVSTEVAVTDRRLIHKSGFFVRHVFDLQLSAVEAVNIDQGFWGRLLNFGRVSVHGTGDDVWRTPIIADPVAFRRDVESALFALGGGKKAPQ